MIRGLIFSAISVFSIFCFAFLGGRHMDTVSFVDLKRYQGTWYEIAKLPNWFQKLCVRNTQAKYEILPTGEVQVINTCTQEDGSVEDIVGQARVADPKTNAKLRVAFFKFLGHWNYLFAGDYWVLDLDPGYQTVIVGAPGRSVGWILSRSQSLSRTQLRKLSTKLEALEYNPCEFEITPQKNGAQKALRLCDVIKN